MATKDFPVTPAIRMLKEKNIQYTPFIYDYEEKGGTRQTSIELDISEHIVIKTLVFVTDQKKPLIVLMHGDCEVSTKELARVIGAKKIEPANAQNAMKYTGYQFGGTSPFGTKFSMDIYVEHSIFDLDLIYINGGKRGFIIAINPADLFNVFSINKVNVAIRK